MSDKDEAYDLAKQIMESYACPDNAATMNASVVMLAREVIRLRGAAGEENPWHREVIDALIVGHIYRAEHDDNPRKALSDLLEWEAIVALDPKVSAEARALQAEARNEALEEAAKVCESERRVQMATAERAGPLGRPIYWARAEGCQMCASTIRALKHTSPQADLVADMHPSELRQIGRMLDNQSAPAVPTKARCGRCQKCLEGQTVDWGNGFKVPVASTRMILCETCGNKRCPHATDCALACTDSNEPGQAGSSYAASPTAAPEGMPEEPRWIHQMRARLFAHNDCGYEEPLLQYADTLRAYAERVTAALEMISGTRQCVDGLLSDKDIARIVLKGGKPNE